MVGRGVGAALVVDRVVVLVSPWLLLLLWPAFGTGVLVGHLLTRPRRLPTYRPLLTYTVTWRDWPTSTSTGRAA